MAKTFGKGINPMKGQDEDKPDLDPARGLGEQAMERMIGKIEIPDDGREVVKPIPLTQITPDLAQPRKAIPTVVSKAAKQDSIPEWQAWHRIAEQLHGQPIDLKALLRGESEITPEEAAAHPLVKGFLSLAGLAASINRDKLTNAITVVRVPGMAEAYEIETGERRWQAHRMLHAVLGKERFGKIKARIVEKASVWRQATENGVRDELTAIGKARQMALLLMDWYSEHKGVQFLPYREIVGDNESNRAFYAQVADGLRFKVPDGHGDSFLQAIGLKSKSQLSRYRSLLELPDELWIQADEEDWAEFKIRTEMEEARLPTGNHSDAHQPPATDLYGRPIHPPMTIKKGEGPGTKATKAKVLFNNREIVEYHDSDAKGVEKGFNILIMHFDANETRTYSEIVHSSTIKDLPHPDAGKPTGGFPSPADPFVAPRVSYDVIGQGSATQLKIGQWRKQPSGRVVEILSILANDVAYAEISPATGRPMGRFVMTIAYAASLPIAAKDVLPTPQVPFEDDEEAFDKDASQAAIMGLDEDDADAMNGIPTVMNEAVDNPLSTEPDQDPLPEWAQRGKTVIHTPSGTVCEVVATVVDAIEDSWYLRCKTGDGEWGDLRLDECAPYEEPIQRHPGMDPKNLTRVITEKQFEFNAIRNLAADYKMGNEADLIGQARTCTPSAIFTFLDKDGYEGTIARIEAQYEALVAAPKRSIAAADEWYFSALELARQKAAAKQGA